MCRILFLKGLVNTYIDQIEDNKTQWLSIDIHAY